MELFSRASQASVDLVQAHPYLPIAILFGIAVGFTVITLIMSWAARKGIKKLEGNDRFETTNLRPYECGMEPVGDTRERQIVRFFVIAMLFIIFDVETIFMYPWAIVFDELGVFALVEMILFIFILLAAYVYVWRKGGLKWDRE